MGIERNRYPKLNQMKPIRFVQLGNKKTDVAVFYESSKNVIDFWALYEEFIKVSEEVMMLGII